MLVAALGLADRLYHWQVVDAAALAARASREHTMVVPLAAPRGQILDSAGRPLATNVVFSRVYAIPPNIHDALGAAAKLAPVLGRSVPQLLALLRARSDFVTLARKQPPQVRDQVLALHLPGIGLEPDVTRVYPNGTLAAQALGFVNYQGQGNYGVEQYDNAILSGKPGELRATRDGLGHEIDLTHAVRVPPIPGESIELTIDRTIQFDAERQLQAGIRRYGARSGSVVVMNPDTGAILALANYPTYDPNRFPETPPARFVDAAISTPFEPGSTFKLITLATAIQDGAVTPNTTLDDPGYLTADGATIRDWDRRPHGVVTMRQVLDQSLNVGAAFAARRTGAAAFYAGVRAFGFGRRTGVDLQGEAAGQVQTNTMPGWYPIQLITNAFGQGLTATPLQMAVAISALANGGALLRPYLVQAILGPKGVQVTSPRVVGHPVSPATAATLTNMMEEVVAKGEATKAQVPGYLVAGKTGTAQIARNGAYRPHATMASFVGFLPAQRPAVVIYLVVDHPTTSPYGALTATPMVARLAQQIMVHLGIAPTQPIPTPAATAAPVRRTGARPPA